MSRQVALQMDPIEKIDFHGDSSFVMGLEAQNRGYQLWHYGPADLSLVNGEVRATARKMTLRDDADDWFSLGEAEDVNIADMDVVLMRQDPPFDMSYITATHFLEHVHPKTLVVNDPSAVRNAPEKLLVTHFPDLMPETVITRDIARIKAFRDTYKDIIMKPLFGNGGAGVFHLKPDDENMTSLFEMFCEASRDPIIVQRYLPEVRQGDKRIILVDGEPVGAINRVPAEGEARANMHVGGQAMKSVLTERDQEICDRIGPYLRDNGLIFVGIDVIGNWLTEINVTSPTGLQEIGRYDDTSLESLIWDAIDKKLG